LIRLFGAVLCLVTVSAVAQAAPRKAAALSGFALENITAVDGSTLSLQRVTGGVLRTISSGGVDRKTVFRLLHDGLGTVSESDGPEHVVGLFLLGEDGIATEYTDGRSEILALDDAGGASLMLKSSEGEISCTHCSRQVIASRSKNARRSWRPMPGALVCVIRAMRPSRTIVPHRKKHENRRRNQLGSTKARRDHPEHHHGAAPGALCAKAAAFRRVRKFLRQFPGRA
jgi:hypothetical protein